MPRYTLRLVRPKGRAERKVVPRPTTIGRGEACGIQLHSDGSVSGIHALLEPVYNGILVTDLGSTNGTKLNRQRIQRARALGGSEIVVGNTLLGVQEEEVTIEVSAVLGEPREPTIETFGSSTSLPIMLGDYTLDERAPTHASGTVFFGENNRTHERIVARQILVAPDRIVSLLQRFHQDFAWTARQTFMHALWSMRAEALENGELFFIRRYAEGLSLRQWSEQRPSTTAVLVMAGQLFRGLAEIHALGFAHGHLTPSNVIVNGDSNEVSVKLAEPLWNRIQQQCTGESVSEILASHAALLWWCPDAIHGRRPMHVSDDLYCAGLAVYYAFTGRLPMEHEPNASVVVPLAVRAVLQAPRTPLQALRPDLAPELTSLVNSLIQISSERRDAMTATSAAEAFESWASAMATSPVG